MKTFYSFFPYTKKEYLMKPNGFIPYTFYKEFGYESHIVTYNIDDYNDKNIEGVKFDFIKRITGIPWIDVVFFLLKNSKKIDIFHTFFWKKENYFWVFLYKLLNKKGKIYITMDSDERVMKESMKTCGIKGKIKTYFLNKCDLISAETKDVYNWLKDNWYENIKYIPYGVVPTNEIIKYDYKENVIITVGRIGTYQKATEILLEAFTNINTFIPNWKLKIIGPIEKDFEDKIKKFYKENPELRKKVEFVGPIYERNKLFDEYKKAKVFCLTSRYESFGLVLAEAASRGCYIISSNISPARDLSDNERYGSLFEIDNINQLSEVLKDICNNEKKIEKNCEKIQEYIIKNFTWKESCKKAIQYLNKKIEK